MKIAIAGAHKGGVGKTTISQALTVTAAHSMYGKLRVLALDWDPQGNLSQRWLKMQLLGGQGVVPPIHPEFDPHDPEDEAWGGMSSAADLVTSPDHAVPYSVSLGPDLNFDFLPTHKEKMREIENCFSKGEGGQYLPHITTNADMRRVREAMIDQLRKILWAPEVQQHYDLCVIDCGPTDSLFLQSALRAATHLAVPVVPEVTSAEGLTEMMGLWADENSYREEMGVHPALEHIGIIINKYDGRLRLHKEVTNAIRDDEVLGPMCLPTTLPQRVAYPELDKKGDTGLAMPYLDLPSSSVERVAMLTLMCTMLSKIFPEHATRFRRVLSREHKAAKV